MDIKQLKYFVAVAEEEHMTRAAKRLFMAQPPLSRQISLLEQELGVILFDRNGKRLKLTETGKRLYHKAQNILHQLDEMVLETKESKKNISGELSIGALMSCIPILSDKIMYFRDNYPLVSFKIWEDIPSRLIELLEKRIIEIALVRTPTFEAKGFAVSTVETERFYLAVPKNMDPFPDKCEITLKTIKNLPLILLHSGQYIGYNELIIRECDRLGFQPNIICQCSNSTAALLLVIDGIGATILPQQIVTAIPGDTISLKNITDFSLQTDISLVWDNKRYLSNCAKKMLELFQINEENFM
ncbi:MAG: LysR family transcriptional regulator [Bacillota bacterium]|jgi:DNA-binding transcriptional LysR family regulator